MVNSLQTGVLCWVVSMSVPTMPVNLFGVIFTTRSFFNTSLPTGFDCLVILGFVT